MKNKPTIIFEDEAIVIVNKPADYLTIPDRHAPERPNLLTFLTNQFGKMFVVHRLDRETSGIICFAKTAEAHRHLSLQFEKRNVQKIYYTLVEGKVHHETGEIDKPIAPSQSTPGKMVIAPRGKASLTHYKVLEYFDNYTLVAADIKTGRTHQVRIHFQAIGYPLAVDYLYGRQDGFYLSTIKLRKYKKSKDEEERPLMNRTTLHAQQLQLDHPSTGERMKFEAELPKDFNAVLKQLRKWGKKKTKKE